MNIAATIDRLRGLHPALVDAEVEKELAGKSQSKVVLQDRALLVTALREAELWPDRVRERARRRA